MTQPPPDPSLPPEPPTPPAPATEVPISAYQPPQDGTQNPAAPDAPLAPSAAAPRSAAPQTPGGYAPAPGVYSAPSPTGYPSPPQSGYPAPQPGSGNPQQPGYPQSAYPQPGYPQPGYPAVGYGNPQGAQAGYGYPQPGYGTPQPGYPNPQGGYFPPVPGYYPPPTAPARPRNNKIWFAIGAGVLVVVLLCFGGGVLLIHRAASSINDAAPYDDQPAAPGLRNRPNPLASLEATQFKAVGSDGTPLALGQTLTAQDGAGDKIRLTISKVKFQKKPCYSFVDLPPGKGLLIADLTVQVDAGSFRASEFDFRLNAGSGSRVSAFEGIMSGCGKSLANTIQRPGTPQNANLIFETEAARGEIVFSPVLSPTPVGSWTVG